MDIFGRPSAYHTGKHVCTNTVRSLYITPQPQTARVEGRLGGRQPLFSRVLSACLCLIIGFSLPGCVRLTQIGKLKNLELISRKMKNLEMIS